MKNHNVDLASVAYKIQVSIGPCEDIQYINKCEQKEITKVRTCGQIMWPE